MQKKTLKKFNPILWFIAYATIAQGLRLSYHIKAKNKALFKQIKPPFILVGNHVTFWDPPMVNSFIKQRIHFVMSDANLRNSIARWLFIKMAAVIPKTKARSDSSTVRQMMRLAKDGRVICVFPEGRATWDGQTHEIFYSTSKLIKSLKIPVIVALTRGGYLTRPRWSRSPHRGRMLIEYSQLFDKEELKFVSAEEIHKKLQNALWHDDYEYQTQYGVKFKSKNQPEYLERVLFICPVCKQLITLESHKSLLSCKACGFQNEYTETGELVPVNNAKQPRRRIYDWTTWQSSYLETLVKNKQKEDKNQPIFEDHNVTVKTGFKFQNLKGHMTGTLAMYVDRFEIQSPNGDPQILYIEDMTGVQVLLSNRFEFYHKNTLYKFDFEHPNTSGYKYMLAVQKIAPERTELE
ncbi:MAG: lysophospholipid acyltransferase family protein [candidate division KSB1 bacterium]|nr:lysophospholipid acyltransferase family protein [candidate division KSB1 bacterium]